jgi:hypothetical protein
VCVTVYLIQCSHYISLEKIAKRDIPTTIMTALTGSNP